MASGAVEHANWKLELDPVVSPFAVALGRFGCVEAPPKLLDTAGGSCKYFTISGVFHYSEPDECRTLLLVLQVLLGVKAGSIHHT